MYLGFLLIINLLFVSALAQAQQQANPILLKTSSAGNVPESVQSAKPLDNLTILNAGGKTITITDGNGNVYVEREAVPVFNFSVGGSLGTHKIIIKDKKGKQISEISFHVDAVSVISDGGRYSQMFDLFYKGMESDETGSIKWNGKDYRFFVSWGLDHCHTMKGLKYFLSFGSEFADLMRSVQRDDGMIYSFVSYQNNLDYYKTRDSLSGYTKKIGDRYFTRQPTENHPEYIHVKTIYQCWKATGDDDWMKKQLSSAARALDYSMNDPARWSKRFGLLKRVYTIDSWDFQVEDEYLPNIGITNSMIIDPEKSKFGVFFGDNTGYILACNQLGEMYEQAGLKEDADKYRKRAREIGQRLDALAWNGKFYTHYIDEDSTVKRDLGVDEKSQLAQSNAYTLNRGLSHDKSKAIIESYIELKNNLPVGSPGEWYAIYPPFKRGFTIHNDVWQYMNGGVGGHVAGELARGAFEHGYEKYGVDILERLYDLGKKYDNKIYFAYTGSIPPAPPLPKFRTVNLAPFANMDSWDKGSKGSFPWMMTQRSGDDLRNLPVGENSFQGGIRFNVIDPAKNNRKAVVAVSKRKGFPSSVEIPVQDTSSCIYMLHTSTKPTSEKVSGAVSILYADGTKITRYMIMDKQLTYWWFSTLETDHSGIAWYGSNAVSRGIGLSWCAINNPNPHKVISKIILHSPEDEGIYTVLGISLSNQTHYVPVKPTSFGGPDNWAAATAMAAMVEGLAGVKDSPMTEAFNSPTISPRWNQTTTDSVHVVIRYAASKGYVAYNYVSDKASKKLKITASGSGEKMNCHFMLPDGVADAKEVRVNDKPVAFTASSIERSAYVNFAIPAGLVNEIEIQY